MGELALAATEAGPADSVGAISSGLLFGLLLVCAIVGGAVAHWCRMPRVVGYLVAGAAAHALLEWILVRRGLDAGTLIAGAAYPLDHIKDLGLGLILFSIGSVFESRHVRAVGRQVLKIVVAESGLTAVLVAVGMFLAGLITASDQPVGVVASFALLMGLAAMATAPAATMFTLQEYEAKGPVTDTVLSVTGLNNVACIVLFHAAFLVLGAAGALPGEALRGGALWYELPVSIGGSVVLGLVLGFLVSIAHAKLHLAETLLILFAVLIVGGAGQQWLLSTYGMSYSFLLTCLCMGAVFTNIAIDPHRLETAVRTIGHPILVGFFVIAGFKLRVDELPRLGAIGATYVVCRAIGKIGGARLGIRWLGPRAELRPYLGAALLCQAAVVIGLADFVKQQWHHDWAGGSFFVTVMGSVVLFEISGPLLIKWVVVRAGEVKVMTLLRRGGAAAGASVTAITYEALLRSLGLGSSRRVKDTGELKVRHVMRTNVKCIPASATFDEVLHSVEQSRYNHFPVVNEQGKLVGVIHFKDVRGLIYNPELCNLVAAADLADPETRAVPKNMPLRESLDVFQMGEVGSLPVVEEDWRVVGIVEQRDVLRAVHGSRPRPGPGEHT